MSPGQCKPDVNAASHLSCASFDVGRALAKLARGRASHGPPPRQFASRHHTCTKLFNLIVRLRVMAMRVSEKASNPPDRAAWLFPTVAAAPCGAVTVRKCGQRHPRSLVGNGKAWVRSTEWRSPSYTSSSAEMCITTLSVTPKGLKSDALHGTFCTALSLASRRALYCI